MAGSRSRDDPYYGNFCKDKDVMTILIIGIMLASGLSAVVNILQYFSNETMLKAYVVWTMGSLGNLSSGQLRFWL